MLSGKMKATGNYVSSQILKGRTNGRGLDLANDTSLVVFKTLNDQEVNNERFSWLGQQGTSRIEETSFRKLLCDAAWARIGSFLQAEGKLQEVTVNRRKYYERVLYEADTIFTAHFLVMRRCRDEQSSKSGGYSYTLGELAQAMVQSSSDSALRTMEQKIRDQMLPRIGDFYGLFEYSKPSALSRNKTACYKIWASEKLMNFYDTMYIPRLLEIMEGTSRKE